MLYIILIFRQMVLYMTARISEIRLQDMVIRNNQSNFHYLSFKVCFSWDRACYSTILLSYLHRHYLNGVVSFSSLFFPFFLLLFVSILQWILVLDFCESSFTTKDQIDEAVQITDIHKNRLLIQTSTRIDCLS